VKTENRVGRSAGDMEMGEGSGCQIAMSFLLISQPPTCHCRDLQGSLSSFLPLSASTSVSLGSGVVVKRVPGRVVPIQKGKEGMRPEGLQNIYCSETVSVYMLVCMHVRL